MGYSDPLVRTYLQHVLMSTGISTHYVQCLQYWFILVWASTWKAAKSYVISPEGKENRHITFCGVKVCGAAHSLMCDAKDHGAPPYILVWASTVIYSTWGALNNYTILWERTRRWSSNVRKGEQKDLHGLEHWQWLNLLLRLTNYKWLTT